jgi:hypothetical protein
MPATRPSTIEYPVDDFTMTPADQRDHGMKDRMEALRSSSHNLKSLWWHNESDHEHDSPVVLMIEHDYAIAPDHITEDEVISHKISNDSSINVDDAVQGNEAIGLERGQNN